MSLFEFLAIVLSLFVTALIGVLFVEKTGHPKWIGALAIVPVVNALLLLYLLMAPWPVNSEVAMRRLEQNEGSMKEAWDVYLAAVRAQKRGKFREARRMYQAVVHRFPDAPPGRDAAISIKELPKEA